MKGKISLLIILSLFLIAGCSQADNWLEEKVGNGLTKDESKNDTLIEQDDEKGNEHVGEEDKKNDKNKQSKEGSENNSNESLSYLADVTNDYVYQAGNETTTVTYVGELRSGDMVWDHWQNRVDEADAFLLSEDEDAMYIGFIESEYYEELVYPIENGKEFGDEYTGFSIITDVEMTVETPAGIFEDVVEVSHDYGIIYYAPNIGTIKSTDEHGEVVSELVEIIPQK